MKKIEKFLKNYIKTDKIEGKLEILCERSRIGKSFLIQEICNLTNQNAYRRSCSGSKTIFHVKATSKISEILDNPVKSNNSTTRTIMQNTSQSLRRIGIAQIDQSK